MQALSLVLLLVAFSQLSSSQVPADGFSHSRGPVPAAFHLGSRYPDRSEEAECRPIRLRIARNSRLYRTELVTNTNPHIIFRSSDARIMTSRLHERLNSLAERYFYQVHARITVLRAWSEYAEGADDNDPNSLHYEGKVTANPVSSCISFIPL